MGTDIVEGVIRIERRQRGKSAPPRTHHHQHHKAPGSAKQRDVHFTKKRCCCRCISCLCPRKTLPAAAAAVPGTASDSPIAGAQEAPSSSSELATTVGDHAERTTMRTPADDDHAGSDHQSIAGQTSAASSSREMTDEHLAQYILNNVATTASSQQHHDASGEAGVILTAAAAGAEDSSPPPTATFVGTASGTAGPARSVSSAASGMASGGGGGGVVVEDGGRLVCRVTPTESPRPRYGHTLTDALDGRLVLFGGTSTSATGAGTADASAVYYNDLWVLQTKTFQWNSLDSSLMMGAPSPRFGHSAHLHRPGQLVVFGGAKDGSTWYNDLYVLDVTGHFTSWCWRKVTDGTTDSESDTGIIQQQVRGRRSSSSRAMLKPKPAPRRSHTLLPFKHGGAVLYGGHGRVSMGDVWLLDEGLQWSEVYAVGGDNPEESPFEGVPEARYCHIAAIHKHDGQQQAAATNAVASTLSSSSNRENSCETTTNVAATMYVWGGFTAGGLASDDLFALDLQTHVWRTVRTFGVPPRSRFGHTASVIGNNRMVVFGGMATYPHGTCLNDSHVFNFESREWRQLDGGHCPYLAAHPEHKQSTESPQEPDESTTEEEEGEAQAPSTATVAGGISSSSLADAGTTSTTTNEQQTSSTGAAPASSASAGGSTPFGRRLHAACGCSATSSIVIFGGWNGTESCGECFTMTVAPPSLREFARNFIAPTYSHSLGGRTCRAGKSGGGDRCPVTGAVKGCAAVPAATFPKVAVPPETVAAAGSSPRCPFHQQQQQQQQGEEKEPQTASSVVIQVDEEYAAAHLAPSSSCCTATATATAAASLPAVCEDDDLHHHNDDHIHHHRPRASTWTASSSSVPAVDSNGFQSLSTNSDE